MTTLTPSDFAAIESLIDKKINERLLQDRYLSQTQAMNLLSIKTKYLFNKAKKELGLTVKQVGRSYRYSEKEIHEKLKQL